MINNKQEVKKEARKSQRVSVKGGMVEYKLKGGLFAFLEGTSEQYPILNISQRGLRFLTRDQLKPGDKLSFKIGIPLLGGQPIKADGRVVWAQRSPQYKANVVGVEFTAMTKDSVARLKNLIDFLGKRIMVRQRVKFDIPQELSSKPLIWQLARDFEITLNIRQGVINEQSSSLIVDLEGEKEEVQRALNYLRELGVKIFLPASVTKLTT